MTAPYERERHSALTEITLRGVVQGVGFRPFVYRLACQEGLGGTVSNDSTGVTVRLYCDSVARERFLTRLHEELPPGAVIDHLDWRELSPDGAAGSDGPFAFSSPACFRIVASEHHDDRRLSIPPDLATCQDCLRELFDPNDRRYRYPFINCTHCGPRFTIATDVPYDRPATTMARFEMCADCRREYEDPLDRRYHAQPIACPVCGPQLELVLASGQPVPCPDPILVAAQRLLDGEIVATKGLGGYHLACRADDTSVVARLRERKRRDHKPFAIMVRDLEAARAIAEVDAVAEALLTGPEAPIVLLAQHTDPGARHAFSSDSSSDSTSSGSASFPIAPNVAPGLDLIGLLLPYTPLHTLLLEAMGSVPLVMTSANLSDHPIVHRDADCLERLASIADLFLVHDREIAGPADDSVVRIVRDRPLLVRRSRGYTPRTIVLHRPVVRPILAVGGQLKNTFCMAVGDTAYFGPHLGDLDDLDTYDTFCGEIERLERFLGVEPEILAHDLHPDYLSTRYALERARQSAAQRQPLETVAVQHHHAHLASALAEIDSPDLDGPTIDSSCLGVIYDGTGYGTDGTSWGGELLWGDARGYERVATLRPLALAGGERAIHEPWRLALTLVLDASLEASLEADSAFEELELFHSVDANSVQQVRRLLEHDLNCPLAHGAGRYFDAFGALTLAQPHAHYEGELALRFERLAASLSDPTEAYPFRLDQDQTPWQIDLRPTVHAMVSDLRASVDAATVAARAHGALAQATAFTIEAACRAENPSTGSHVVLSGGCFNNALLTEQIAAALARSSSSHIVLHQHRSVPPGDGGLALGQLMVAASAATRKRDHQSDPWKGSPICV